VVLIQLLDRDILPERGIERNPNLAITAGEELLLVNITEGGYLLHSGRPYRLWSGVRAAAEHLIMDSYGTGSMATACCTSR
jgi:hypothetical protein